MPVLFARLVIPVLFLFLNLNPSVWAGASWKGTEAWVQKFSTQTPAFSGSALTAWAALQVNGRNYPNAKFEIYPVSNSAFLSSTPVAISLQKDTQGKVLRRPLMVFFPGIFEGISGKPALWIIDHFRAKGYHVLVLPNPWSEEWIKSVPRELPGIIRAEAKAFLEILTLAKKHIGAEAIERTDVLGKSYGGFLSLLVATHSGVEEIIDGTISIFSPPKDFFMALKGIDFGILKTQDQYSRECSGWLTQLRIYRELKNKPNEASLSDRVKSCLDPILFKAAQTGLIQRTHQIDTLVTRFFEDPSKIPSKYFQPLQYKAWKKEFTFHDYMRTYVPLTSAYSRDNQLLSWFEHISPTMQDRIRILSTQDDFLNEGQDWLGSDAVALQKTGQLLVLPWGGHTGYFEVPEFQEFLKITFPAVESRP